ELSLRADAIRIAEARSADRSTWMYLFTWPSPARGGVTGACHALDLPFIFGTLDAPGMKEFAGAGSEAEALSAAIMDAWTAFARGHTPWPCYDGAHRATFEFGPARALSHAPLDAERALIERFAGRADWRAPRA